MARNYTTKKVRIGGETYYYSSREELVNLYEKFRETYNQGIKAYGKGRQRYQLQGAGKKTYTYLDKQLRMMARRINTGVYEQTGAQFKRAFIESLYNNNEIFGDLYGEDVEILINIFERMHHTQFTSFYNSLSKTDRAILFDTDNYYLTSGSNAIEFAERTIKKLIEFAETNNKVKKIIIQLAEYYPSLKK